MPERTFTTVANLGVIDQQCVSAEGYLDSESELDDIYENGEGVANDEIEGLAWINIAAASGDEDLIKERNSMESRLGRDATLSAQQRSKAILKEIEVNKARNSNGAPALTK